MISLSGTAYEDDIYRKGGGSQSSGVTGIRIPAPEVVGAVIALRIAVGSREYDPAADVSDDGMVTSLDALMILQAAAV